MYGFGDLGSGICSGCACTGCFGLVYCGGGLCAIGTLVRRMGLHCRLSELYIYGLYSGLALPFVLVWALADFFEGFIPLVAYRKLKIRKAKLRNPKITYTLMTLLLVDVAVSAAAMIFVWTEVFIATFAVGIAILALETVFEDRKSWVTWLFFGVFIASVASGIFGAGALGLFGIISTESFPTAFIGWVFGDIIVLSTIATILMLTLTPHIQKTKIYVKNYLT